MTVFSPVALTHTIRISTFLVMFKDDANEMVKITYAGLTSSASLNSVTDFLGEPRNRGDRDIYSIGSIAYQLLSGGREPPTSVDSFCEGEDPSYSGSSSSPSRLQQKLFLGRIWKRIPISRAAKNFIESCMQHGFLTVNQALQHRWITQTSIYMQGTGASLEESKEAVDVAVVQNNPSSSIAYGNNGDADRRSDRTTEKAEEVECTSVGNVDESQSAPLIVPLPVLLPRKRDDDSGEAPKAIPRESDSEVFSVDEKLGEDGEAVSLSTVKYDLLVKSRKDEKGDNLSDDESVGAPPPPDLSAVTPVIVRSATPDAEEVNTARETNEVIIESESSDEESVGVVAPPSQSTAKTPNGKAPPAPESPQTPKQSPIGAVAMEQASISPESPSQTPSDFADLRDAFHEVDNEGEVTIAKLREKLRSKYTEEEVNSWVKNGNFDDSRNVKYKEFLAEAIRSRRHIERLRVQEAFEKIDKGKQGFVTVGNLRAVLGADNSEYIEKMMKEADTKRDGRITYEKFKEVLERSFRH